METGAGTDRACLSLHSPACEVDRLAALLKGAIAAPQD